MKATYTKKIARLIEQMESLIEQMEQEQENLQEKIDAIEEKAAEKDRDTTDAEDGRIADLQEIQDEYCDCADQLQNAIDYISEYAE